MAHLPDLRFNTYRIADVLEGQLTQSAEAIRAMSPDSVLSTPLEDLVDEMDDRFCVNRLVLDWDGRTSTGVSDAKISIGGYDGRVIDIEGSRVEILVPFEGDRLLFDVQPSSFTLSPPRFDIRGGNVVIPYEGRSPIDPETMAKAMESLFESIQQNVKRQYQSIDPWMEGLRSRLTSQIADRRAKVMADRQVDSFLNVPVVGRDNPAPILAVNPVKRRRTSAGPKQSAEPFVPEPGITDGVFEEILGAIEGVQVAVQRLPTTFEDMPEESLRDVLLVALNNQFGPASGETFSRKGKTDILIPYNGDPGAVFIAECKWWKGPAGFRKAIDQLLGYITWRDTHAALIVFIRTGSPVDIEKKAKKELEAHSGFKRVRSGVGARDLYTFANSTDAARELHLALLLVPVLP